jgi:uncharacterized protein
MKLRKNIVLLIVSGLCCLFTLSCKDKSRKTEAPVSTSIKSERSKLYNPVVYFEIPVTDIDRGIKFYSAVFNFVFEKDTIDKNEMALFPFKEESLGISGALAKGDIYKPTKNGTLIYFNTESIDQALLLVIKNGGKVLYPKTSIGDKGFVAEFEDSEGNRIALHQQ